MTKKRAAPWRSPVDRREEAGLLLHVSFCMPSFDIPFLDVPGFVTRGLLAHGTVLHPILVHFVHAAGPVVFWAKPAGLGEALQWLGSGPVWSTMSLPMLVVDCVRP